MTDRTLIDVFENEYVRLNTRLRSNETKRLYRVLIRNLSAFLERDAMLSDLTDDVLVGFMRHRESLGKSPNTVHGECSKLFAMWRWFTKRGFVDKFPTIVEPPEKRRTPTAWSRQEVRALLKAAYNCDGMFCNVPRSQYFYCLLRMAWETGERHGALHRVLWKDIDLDGRWVNYRGETRKGAMASDNRQKISRGLARELRRFHEASPHDLVFGFAEHSSLYPHLKALNRAAGLPTGRHDMFHRMRRSHATHLYAAGGDATVSLGHSSDYITRKCYLDPKFIRKTFGADVLQGFFGRMVDKVKSAFGR